MVAALESTPTKPPASNAEETAEDSAAQGPQARPTLGSLIGFVDRVNGRRVTGWAWDRSSPTERLEVEVWVDDNRVASAQAGSERADLRRKGIGDGQHGFTIDLAEPPTGTVKVYAKAPASGELVPLLKFVPEVKQNQSAQESLRMVRDVVENLQTTEQQFRDAAGTIVDSLRVIADRLPPSSMKVLERLMRVVKEAQETHEMIGQRMVSLEAAVTRQDSTLRELTEWLRAASQPQRRSLPAILLMALAVLVGAAFGIGFGVLFGSTIGM